MDTYGRYIIYIYLFIYSCTLGWYFVSSWVCWLPTSFEDFFILTFCVFIYTHQNIVLTFNFHILYFMYSCFYFWYFLPNIIDGIILFISNSFYFSKKQVFYFYLNIFSKKPKILYLCRYTIFLFQIQNWFLTLGLCGTILND